MKKVRNHKRISDLEMLAEYDFSKGVLGKYAKRYAKGANIVIIAPDVAKVFSDSTAVNEALRTLLRMASKTPRKATG